MKKFLLVLLVIVSVKMSAQDIQFAQFYASALYLNPAFAGSDHHNRIMMHQRLQWPRIDGKYNTSMFGYDRYFEQYQSGFGVMIIQDFQGTNDLRTTDLSVQYAYETHFDQNHSMRLGLQVGYLSRSVGYGLIFPQNLTTNGLNPLNPPTAKVQRKGMADISAGWLFYSKNFYVSVSTHHINKPNTDFTVIGIPDASGNLGRLPRRFAIVGGYRIPLKTESGMKAYAHMNDPKRASITPTFHYKVQGKSDQLDLGLYGAYEQLLVGVWYRGIPVKRYRPFDGTAGNPIKGLHNNESVVGVIGWMYNGIDLTYSYDFVLSRLRIARTFGSHEINLTFVPHHYKTKPKMNQPLPCPRSPYDRPRSKFRSGLR